MKITFDGITIEDATAKEAADVVKLLKGKAKISTTKAGVYKLPGKIRQPQKNAIENAWTNKELLFIIDNIGIKPKKLSKSPILAERGLTAISAKKSAIKSGLEKRMGIKAYKLMQSRKLQNRQNDYEKNGEDQIGQL